MSTRRAIGLIAGAIFLGVSVFFGFSRLAIAELSADSFCKLVIESMKLEKSNYNEIIALANEYKNDPQAFAQQEETKRIQLDKAKVQLYSSYGTTAEEFVTYMDRNGDAVKAYLEAHPDIKQQIDDLSAQLQSLMKQEEALMAPSGDASVPPSQ